MIKVQAGTQEKVHFSTKLKGKNLRPICGTTSRMAYFTKVSETAEVNCTKCLAAL